MQKPAQSRRTLVLVAIIIALLAANIWWFALRTPEEPVPAFELGATGGLTVGVTASDAAAAPLFDPIHDGWTSKGRKVGALKAYRQKADPANSTPHVDFVTVRLADDANSEQVRRALLSLSAQNLCYVVLIDATRLPADGASVPTPVHRIVSVRGNDGEPVSCRQP